MVINDKFTYCGGSGFCDCRSLLDPWTMTLNCKSYKALQKIFFNVSRHVSRYLSRHVSHDFSRFPVHAGTVQERLQALPGNRNVQILGVPKWWKSNESKWDHLVKKRIERFRLQNQFNMSRTHCSKHQDTFLIQSQVWTRKPKIEIKHWQKAEQQSATCRENSRSTFSGISFWTILLNASAENDSRNSGHWAHLSTTFWKLYALSLVHYLHSAQDTGSLPVIDQHRRSKCTSKMEWS